MYDELVKRLRKKAEAFDYDGWVETAIDYEEAADVIEKFQDYRKAEVEGRMIISFPMIYKDFRGEHDYVITQTVLGIQCSSRRKKQRKI